MTEAPLVQCRVAYNRGSKTLRPKRASFVEALAARLRLLTPEMVIVAHPDAIRLNDGNFRVWTEALQQGAEHRPDLFVELFPRIGVQYLDPFAPSLTGVFVRTVWAEVRRLDETILGAGFRTVTVGLRFPAPCEIAVDVDSGRVVSAANAHMRVGWTFETNDPAILAVYSRLPR